MQASVEPERRKVIVVDDDPILREVMSEQLAQLGWQVTTADDGQQGLDAIIRDNPDLAIVDLNMPKLDGYGILRHLRHSPQTLDLPVIVCTSHNDREAIDEAYRLGASHFITKPINWPKFIHHVQFVMRSGDTERALRSAEMEARTASRMKSAMFQVLSHELKTPLTALIGMTDMLEEAFRDRAKAGEIEHLDHIISAARQLNGIVNDVMLLSKALGTKTDDAFAPATLADIADDSVVGLRRRAAARQIKLLLRPVDPAIRVSCDAWLLHQGMAKLVDNAIRFSPEGSTIEVWGHVMANGRAVLSVRDEGPGLSPQKLKECLQPFVQENMGYARPADGLGLGLPIAKAIAEAHGGELVIQTAPGKGLLAAIVLPAGRLLPARDEGAALHA